MKKKIDKVRAIDIQISGPTLGEPGRFEAIVRYDVKKLRRTSDDELVDILFEKTMQLYPFAIISSCVNRYRPTHTATIMMHLPLSPYLKVKEVQFSQI